MIRRVGRYTKYETAELTRMFGEGYSVYKLCRKLNRSQNSIRNNLIKLGLMEGEIKPRRYTTSRSGVEVNDSIGSLIWNSSRYAFILSSLTILFVLKPQFNILVILLLYIFYKWL